MNDCEEWMELKRSDLDAMNSGQSGSGTACRRALSSERA
jgi:hypothetical protein